MIPRYFPHFLFSLAAINLYPVKAATTLPALPTPSAELPEVLATSSTPTASASGSVLDEIGLYQQPGWTKQRRFSTTRVFVQKDPWEMGVEQWWRGRASDGGIPQHRFIEEFEIGLPYRAQLDLYYDWTHKHRTTSFEDFGAEIRWAMADWGTIPLNPTLYAEYKWVNHDLGGDVLELKLLLGDNVGKDLSYGVNFIWEQELSGEKTTEYQVVGGLSYDFCPAMSAGMEIKYDRETVADARGNPEHKLLAGPSLQWRPTHAMHIDLVSLIGVTKAAPDVEAYVIVGFDFDFGKPAHKAHQPVSGAHN